MKRISLISSRMRGKNLVFQRCLCPLESLACLVGVGLETLTGNSSLKHSSMFRTPGSILSLQETSHLWRHVISIGMYSTLPDLKHSTGVTTASPIGLSAKPWAMQSLGCLR